jgi:HD superfamily phosphohydrolase
MTKDMTKCAIATTDSICRQYKIIHDALYGSVQLTEFAIRIIDTIIFQRLRKLKQVGTCNYVFPNAIHTRFEHSIGTYHNATKILDEIIKNSSKTHIANCLKEIKLLNNYFDRSNKSDYNKYKFDSYICELIKIAALCHDLGHGPFSHVYDDIFIPETDKKESLYSKHEIRSCVLLRKIIKEDILLRDIIHDDEIEFMNTLINPKIEHIGFIYQIVSNNKNSLDVDKYDYIKRDSYYLGIDTSFNPSRLIEGVVVSENNICFPEQSIYDIVNLFNTRYQFHKRVYGHKSVISAQFMVTELMFLLDPILKISDCLEDMNKFIELNDDYIIEAIKFIDNDSNKKIYSTNIDIIKKILNDLNRHILYPFIGSYVTDKKTDFDKITFSNNICNVNDILIYQSKIGYVSGSKPNPLDNVMIYKTKDFHCAIDTLKPKKFTRETFSRLTPIVHQEYVTMIFYKHKDDYEIVDKLRKKNETKYIL